MIARGIWLAGISALAATMVDAQTADPQTAPPAATEPAPEEAIVVTGSRIRQPNLASEAPLQSIDSTSLARTGSALVSEALTELPQFGASLNNSSQGQGTANAAFNTGVELVNLRNLGVQRTLVLVNGRRHVGGDPGTSAVDLNAIPTSMVSRIDVVTGAASAIYGADAVSGVVNIILRDEFEGLQLGAGTGISSRGDAADVRASLLLGGKFGDGRGKFVVSGEYYRTDGFLQSDRDYGQTDGNNGLLGAAGGGGSSGIPGGQITGGANGIFIFDSSNTLRPRARAPFAEQFYQRLPVRSQAARNERYVVSLNTSYDLIEKGADVTATAYLESSFANARIRTQIEPQVIFFQGLPRLNTPTESPADAPRIPANNPFLQPLLPVIGAIPAAGVQVNRRFTEQGTRFISVDRDTFRIAAGLRGDLGPRFNYDVYYQYGRVKAIQDETGVLDRSRIAAAVDVDTRGTPGLADDICVDARARALGCVPLNVFGVNSVSPAFLAYATIPSQSLTDARQEVASGFVSGQVFELPAGPVSIVAGLEYRRESSDIDPAPSYLDRTSSVRFLQGASGSFDVFEQFGEVRVPLLADTPFFKALTVSGAVRFSRYSTIGSETSWNVRGDWAINDSIRLRATTGTAVRAPNVNELFAPISRANNASVDPCDRFTDAGAPITLTGNRAASCATALGALAASLDQTQSQRGTVVSQNQGNPDLDAENARTYTAGIVLTPRGDFLRGASLSVDYYNIAIDRVISNLSVQDTVNQCFDQPGLPAVFCDRVLRDPATGQLLGVVNQLFNAASESVEGIDVQFLYGFAPGFVPGRLDLRSSYSHLLRHDFTARAGAAVDRRRGQVGDSADRLQLGATYTQGPFSFSWDTRYLSRAVADTQASGALLLNNRVPAVWTHDLLVGANFDDGRYTLNFGVTNVTDRQPPLVTPPARTSLGDSNVLGGVYDVRGRFFYVSGSVRF